MATNQDLIGRDDVNDLEAILGITNTDVDEVIPSGRRIFSVRYRGYGIPETLATTRPRMAKPKLEYS